MPYILLVLTAFFISVQNILRKQYNVRSKKPTTFLFSLCLSLSALIFFVLISGFKLDFNIAVLPYAIGFALSYGAALVGSIVAISSGSLSLTLLFSSYSLIIPAMHGVIALDEKIGAIGIIGLILLLASILFINLKREKTRINLVWVISVTLCFLGNGMCSLVQKLQQMRFDGGYKNEFMILALALCSIGLFITLLASKENIKNEIAPCIKLGGICGISNGIVNYAVMMLTAMLPSSVLYPSISGGGIVFGFLAALLFFKEKLSPMKYLGYALGLISVILLNI